MARLVKRAWSFAGYVYVETADDVAGEPYYIDHAGRIGVETDDGLVTWFVIAGDRFLAVEKAQTTEEMDNLQSVRLYGVVPARWSRGNG